MNLRRALLLVCSLLVLSSCGGRILRMQVGPIRLWLLVDEDLEAELDRQEEWDEQVLGKIEGQQLRVKDGSLYLDEHNFGPVAEGDRVEVHKQGVTVGGEYRGGLPRSLEPSTPTEER